MENFSYIQQQLPDQPGIYKFYDSDGDLLYVGKAKNIKKRVASYFNNKRHENTRIRLLVKKIQKIDFTIVETEQDALLLENTLIKNHQPKYNVQLKDDKTYPFIAIKNERFPRIFLTRHVVNDGSEYLGPYTSVFVVRTLLELIKSIYPLRTCNLDLAQHNIDKGKFKVCLEYHIGNCKGPCEGLQSEEEYNESIRQIKNILKGKTGRVIQMLKEQMQNCAEEHRFEEAEAIKEKINSLQRYQSKSTIVNPKIDNVDIVSIVEDEDKAFANYLKVNSGTITQTQTIELHKKLDEKIEELLQIAVVELRNRFESDARELIVPFDISLPDDNLSVTVPKIGDKKKLLTLSHKNALYSKNQRLSKAEKKKQNDKNQELLERFKRDFNLSELPTKIECIDNSNIQGSSPVASVVVFKNGKPSNKDYRHFNIKTVEGPNDYASMEEVVYRRYHRLLEEEEELPQLLIIDGGKGQLQSAMKSIKTLELENKITVAGIAKRLEEIYFPGDSLPLYLDKRSPTLKTVQHLRDEAHRFAIGFHRKKSSKKLTNSELTEIDGIGDKTVEALLSHFKSVKKIKQAQKNELASIIGEKKADKIIDYFSRQQQEKPN